MDKSPLPNVTKIEDVTPVSPVKVIINDKKELLTFHQIIDLLLDGKKVTRVEWKNEQIYGELRDNTLQLNKMGKVHAWIVSDGDMMGEDWYVID